MQLCDYFFWEASSHFDHTTTFNDNFVWHLLRKMGNEHSLQKVLSPQHLSKRPQPLRLVLIAHDNITAFQHQFM